jgi:hypothetical protein
VYAGYDGTNEASVIDRRWTGEQDGYIVPTACGPLFEATVLNRVPQEALDGVGTFWEVNGSAVSLFTFRFADLAGADRAGGWLLCSTIATRLMWKCTLVRPTGA